MIVVILINPEKVEKELFKPSIEFDKGIEDTVAWYVDNRKWWEAILERSGELAIDWSGFVKS